MCTFFIIFFYSISVNPFTIGTNKSDWFSFVLCFPSRFHLFTNACCGCFVYTLRWMLPTIIIKILAHKITIVCMNIDLFDQCHSVSRGNEWNVHRKWIWRNEWMKCTILMVFLFHFLWFFNLDLSIDSYDFDILNEDNHTLMYLTTQIVTRLRENRRRQSG